MLRFVMVCLTHKIFDRLPQNAPKFDIEKAIARQVSTINDGIARLNLLPSSIRLIDLQDRIPMIALSENFTANPLEILRSALQPVIDRCDYIIIDCPPSLGAVTKNGLRISTGYVIPTIPDIVGGTLPQPPLLTNTIPQTVAVARSADVDADIRTFKGKYGNAYDALHGLTQELMQKCEAKKR